MVFGYVTKGSDNASLTMCNLSDKSQAGQRKVSEVHFDRKISNLGTTEARLNKKKKNTLITMDSGDASSKVDH